MGLSVSVLIPNYNHARFLGEAIRSVMEQSRPPDELIVVDDASTDGSVGVINELAGRYPRLRFLRNERNLGVNGSVARLLSEAAGDFVMFLAADDMLLPGHLEKSMLLLDQNPRAGLCSTRSREIDESGGDAGTVSTPPVSATGPVFISPDAVARLLAKVGLWVQSNTAIFRRDALVEAGGFRADLYAFSDGFASMVLALRHGACYVPEPLGARRWAGAGYCGSCYADPARVREIVANSTALMRGEFRDLFPNGFAEDWERETLYTFGRMEYHRMRQRQAECLDRLSRVREGLAVPHRFALLSLAAAMIAQRAVFTAGLVFANFPKFTIRRLMVDHLGLPSPRPV